MSINKSNLHDDLKHIGTFWDPHIIAEVNGHQAKLAKIKGEFPWHSHENEDELFLVVKGSFTLEFRDRQEVLKEGDYILVPKGVEHRPIAPDECHILLFEPGTTINTGAEKNEFTRQKVSILSKE